MEKTDWLDTTPTAPAAPAGADVPPAAEDWLEIGDTNAGKVTRAFDHLVSSCMRGTDRVMACDGQYLAYRPFNREFDKETNPRTKERFQMFLEKGYYKHLGTYDEVQIYELLPGNPYRQERKQYIIGQDYWKDIRTAATAACNRQWSDYHDLLGAMATALKSGRDEGFARTMWGDTLNQIAIAVKQIGGANAPTEREINEGFIEIRRARGIRGGGSIMTLDSSGLQKVGFNK